MLAPLALLAQLAAPVGLSLGPTPVPPGAAVPMHVEVARDGYLLVLRMTTDGRVAVLFEGFVPRGVHQLRGAGNRQALIADAGGGTGLVLAALSARPAHLAPGVLADWRDDTPGVDVLSAIAQRAFGTGWLGSAFALYTVRAWSRPQPVIADAAVRPQPTVVVVHQPAVASPAPAEPPLAARSTMERTLIVASVCDVGVGNCLPSGFRRRPPKREPPVKTSGICQIGVDCPPGVGAPAKALPRK